jgi:hypothetical protein
VFATPVVTKGINIEKKPISQRPASAVKKNAPVVGQRP